MPYTPVDSHPKYVLTFPPPFLPLQIASYDQTGPHLFQTDPSGAYYEYIAQAIGSRAQSGKTYLEKYYAEFEELGVDDLIKHALKALSGTTGKCRGWGGRKGGKEGRILFIEVQCRV